MSEAAVNDASSVRYTWRQAYESNAFHQFELVDASKLGREARDRGLRGFSYKLGALEQLDREGAFSPILFDVGSEAADVVFRDEDSFVPWSSYDVDDSVVVEPRPQYSPWQLLYLSDALELQQAWVPIDWLLDDEKGRPVGDGYRGFYGAQLEKWRRVDEDWRNVIRLLVRLSTRYGPSVKGRMLRTSVSMVWDHERNDFVYPPELEQPFDATAVLAELDIDAEAVKQLHRRVAVHGYFQDDLKRFHMLMRMAPAAARARLEGSARRAQDAYDAAEMLRDFYFDLTSDLLPNPDDIFDSSGGEWKRRLFGKWPTRTFTRADLAAELRRHDLHPHQVHVVVEGDTEEIIIRGVIEWVTGRPLNEFGISMHRLQGVDSAQLHHEMLRALKEFPRYVVLIADHEGTIGQEVARLQQDGVISDESTLLWDRSFEENNFSDEELISMITAEGETFGATLTLDASTLRKMYDDYRSRVTDRPKGLATFALEKAEYPEYGSVLVTKPQLAKRMVEFLMDDIRHRGFERVGEDRPLITMLASIVRIT